ncbi:MAG: riboflavin biosynthesis protein RibF [Ruminococcus sp.]|nr:riboflavin biosynthesis protein RibF [Ruminococcus sp.]
MQTTSNLFSEQQQTAVALGFFDGIHRGHRKVLSLASKQEQCGLLPVCLTFAESPKAVIHPEKPFSYLMTRADKLHALASLGIKRTVFADFRSLMEMSAELFFYDVLVIRLRAKELFCGFNYRFGKGAKGNITLLQRLCDENNVGLTIVPPEKMEDDVICSTLIKQLIGEGNVERANKMLDARFGFSAEIIHGKRLGHTLGTPTINQPPAKGLVSPRFGVYASVVTLENGTQYCGVTNVGVKPTVGSDAPLWETWMPDYHGGELYGQNADVRLLRFIRPEQRFASLNDLRAEILRNAAAAKAVYVMHHS